MVCKVTIIVKDEEKTLKTNHLVYDDILISENDDPVLKPLIDEAVRDFGAEPTDVNVRLSKCYL